MRTHLYIRDSTETPVSLPALRRLIDGWLMEGEIRGLSPGTTLNRRHFAGKLLWWLEREGSPDVDALVMGRFFLYLQRGHLEEGGRWGVGETEPLRPTTARTWHGYLSAFWSYAEQNGAGLSPMARIPAPIVRADQVEPMTGEQVLSLITACARGKYPRRDQAVVRFLYDSGCRAAELCGLKMGDLNLPTGSAVVRGKGNKKRTITYGTDCRRALWNYLKHADRAPFDPVFVSERGAAFTVNGLRQLVERLGERAGIQGVRCSPHTLRHSFAVGFLRAGGPSFRLQRLLGHEHPAMTSRYVKMSEADILANHAEFSPGDRLRRK